MKRFLVTSILAIVMMSTPTVATAEPNVWYDLQQEVKDGTFKRNNTFDRTASFRTEGSKVIALPGRGAHWVVFHPLLPENVDITAIIEPRYSKPGQKMDVMFSIGQCSLTVTEAQGEKTIRIVKRGTTVLFDDMETVNCIGDQLKVTTLPNSSVYEIQALTFVIDK